MKLNRAIGITLSFAVTFALGAAVSGSAQAAGCPGQNPSIACPSPSPEAAGSRQEVPNGAGVTQKQFLQQLGTTPAPNASGKAQSSHASRKDWGYKASMTCGKGAVILHLKKIGKCPRGFTKIK